MKSGKIVLGSMMAAVGLVLSTACSSSAPDADVSESGSTTAASTRYLCATPTELSKEQWLMDPGTCGCTKVANIQAYERMCEYEQELVTCMRNVGMAVDCNNLPPLYLAKTTDPYNTKWFDFRLDSLDLDCRGMDALYSCIQNVNANGYAIEWNGHLSEYFYHDPPVSAAFESRCGGNVCGVPIDDVFDPCSSPYDCKYPPQ